MTTKDTKEMENCIKKTKNVEEFKKFVEKNEENFPNFTLDEYLRYLLEEKNLNLTEVVKKSQLGNYAYKIFSGERRNNARNKLLMIGFAIGVTVEEMNRLLYYGNAKKLYAKDEFDAVIIFALNQGYDLKKTNEILTESALEAIIN